MTLTDSAAALALGPFDDCRLAARSGKVAYALEGNISVSAQAAAWMAALMGLARRRRIDDACCELRASRERLLRSGACRPRRAALEGPRARRSDRHVACDVARRCRARGAGGDRAANRRRLRRDGARSRCAARRCFPSTAARRATISLMQWQADLLGRPVKRLKVHEFERLWRRSLAGAAAGLMDEAKVEADLKRSSSVLVRIWTRAGARPRLGCGRLQYGPLSTTLWSAKVPMVRDV